MLRQTPIYHALHRPNLVLGCDRELILCTGLLCAIGILSALSEALLPIAALFVGIWFGALALLRHMAQVDPMMRHIYARHLRYRSYYPARSTPFCRS